MAAQLLGAERLLRVLAAGRAVHAYLLVGPPGSGRRTAAMACAAALLCAHPRADGGACGACAECALTAAGNHPDLHVVAGHRAEDARALLHRAALRPVRAGRAVFVLPDADQLTPEATAMLLKTIEEPPGPAVFILTAASARHLPETIASRCQVLPLLPVEAATLTAWLQERGVAAAEAAALAEAAEGRPGQALALAADGSWRERRNAATRWLAAIGEGSLAEELARAAAAAEACALDDVLAEQRRRVLAAAARPDPEQLAAECRAFGAVLEASAAAASHVSARLTWEVLALRLRQIRGVGYNHANPSNGRRAGR